MRTDDKLLLGTGLGGTAGSRASFRPAQPCEPRGRSGMGQRGRGSGPGTSPFLERTCEAGPPQRASGWTDAHDAGLTWCREGELVPITSLCCAQGRHHLVPTTRSGHNQPDKGHPGEMKSRRWERKEGQGSDGGEEEDADRGGSRESRERGENTHWNPELVFPSQF